MDAPALEQPAGLPDLLDVVMRASEHHVVDVGVAGGVLMSDTCSALGQVMPRGTRVAAVDSAKQAHYLPAIMGVQTWFGTTEQCIRAAITGKWSGGLP